MRRRGRGPSASARRGGGRCGVGLGEAFADSGVVVTPQVETDSVASLYAHVGVGAWASIVPHTWLRAMPVIGRTRAARLVDPDARAQRSEERRVGKECRSRWSPDH